LSTKLYGALAILIVLCFAGLVAIQVIEYLDYAKEPSVWPLAVK
jgi:hypothetical protein